MNIEKRFQELKDYVFNAAKLLQENESLIKNEMSADTHAANALLRDSASLSDLLEAIVNP